MSAYTFRPGPECLNGANIGRRKEREGFLTVCALVTPEIARVVGRYSHGQVRHPGPICGETPNLIRAAILRNLQQVSTCIANCVVSLCSRVRLVSGGVGLGKAWATHKEKA